MFARLVQIVGKVYDYCVELMTNFMVNPYLARQRAGNTIENGVVTQKIRPFISTWNLVTTTHDLPAKRAEKLLRAVMNIDESNARQPYNIVNHVTSSNFFLSLSNQEAHHLRNRLITSFRMNDETLKLEIEKSILDVMNYLYQQTKVTDQVMQFISHEIRSLITRSITGLRLTPKMQLVLDKKMEPAESGFGFLPTMPYLIRLLSSEFRQRKHEFNETLNEFLRAEFKRIYEEGASDNYLLVSLIRDKYPQEPIEKILANDQTVHTLMADPDIRLTVSGALATGNLSPVIQAGMLYLSYASNLNAPRRTHQYLIAAEITTLLESGVDLDEAIMRDNTQLRYLHAYWLESLRCCPPMEGVARTTDQGINVDGLAIPEKSIILIPIRAFAPIENDTIEPSRFEPNRHLNKPDSDLHKGHFTPFGLGPRMCPATRISAYIFKKFIAASAMRMKSFGYDKIEFNKNTETLEQMQPRPILKF